MTESTKQIIAFLFGVLVIALLMLYAHYQECIKPALANLYPPVFAIAAGAVIGMIPGSFKFMTRILFATAGSAGVLVFWVYKPISIEPCPSDKEIIQTTTPILDRDSINRIATNYLSVVMSNDFTKLSHIFDFPMHRYHRLKTEVKEFQVESEIEKDFNSRSLKIDGKLDTLRYSRRTNGNYDINFIYTLIATDNTTGEISKHRVYDTIKLNTDHLIYYVGQRNKPIPTLQLKESQANNNNCLDNKLSVGVKRVVLISGNTPCIDEQPGISYTIYNGYRYQCAAAPYDSYSSVVLDLQLPRNKTVMGECIVFSESYEKQQYINIIDRKINSDGRSIILSVKSNREEIDTVIYMDMQYNFN